MKDYAVVETKEELKKAIDQKIDTIYITNKKLATNIEKIKNARKKHIVLAITALGAGSYAAVSFWNPTGWGAGVVGFSAAAAGGTSSVVLITAIATLGISAVAIYAIKNDYSAKGAGSVTTPSGHTFSYEFCMQRNK